MRWRVYLINEMRPPYHKYRMEYLEIKSCGMTRWKVNKIGGELFRDISNLIEGCFKWWGARNEGGYALSP